MLLFVTLKPALERGWAMKYVNQPSKAPDLRWNPETPHIYYTISIKHKTNAQLAKNIEENILNVAHIIERIT